MKARKLLSLLCALVLFVSLGACTGGGDTSSTANETSTPGSADVSQPQEADTTNEPDGPFGKYDPEITLTVVVATGTWVTLPGDDNEENNAWTRAYKDDLGINIEYLWISSGDDYDDKMNLSIASGDLPDLIGVNRNQFEQLCDADKVADITDAYENYATDYFRENIVGEVDAARDAVTKNGRMYGIMSYVDYTDLTGQLWLRSDWLEELGLSDPKTIDDIEKIALEFMEKKDAAYGVQFIGIQPSSQPSTFIHNSFWNAYGSYPGIWVKDGTTGDLMLGNYMPQSKDALQKLRNWYSLGIIPKDFGVIDHATAFQDTNNGKIGIVFGGLWEAYAYLSQGKDANPDMEWKCIPVPSADGAPIKLGVEPFLPLSIRCIRKGYEHPEALIKMFNLGLKYLYDPATATEDTARMYLEDEDGNAPYIFCQAYGEPLRKNYMIYYNMAKAFESGDTSKLAAHERVMYQQILDYNAGDLSQWVIDISYGPKNSSCSTIDYYLDNNLYVTNEFFGLPTKAMIEKKPTVDKMWAETLTRLITGELDMSAYDSFVETANGLGLEEMTKEANDWYAAR